VAESVEAFRQDPRFAGRVEVRLKRERVSASIDADRMRQVVWNLLTNAAQASPPGSQLRVAVGREGSGGVFSVGDDGVGISPAELPHIFDPFFTRRAGGTGLGLAVVDQIVRGHGGHIDVVSLPGEGTRFTIHLPHPSA
jgi:signal transduction histidine kinase